MKKKQDCAICLDSLNNNTYDLPCNHTLHKKCIKNLIISNCPSKHKCPICRCPFINPSSPILSPISLLNVDSFYMQDLSYDIYPELNQSPIPSPIELASPSQIELAIPSPIELAIPSPIELPRCDDETQIPLPLVQAMLFSFPN